MVRRCGVDFVSKSAHLLRDCGTNTVGQEDPGVGRCDTTFSVTPPRKVWDVP